MRATLDPFNEKYKKKKLREYEDKEEEGADS